MRGFRGSAARALAVAAACIVLAAAAAPAQEPSPEELARAAQAAGLSEEELLRLLAERTAADSAAGEAAAAAAPGRSELPPGAARVVLPLSLPLDTVSVAALAPEAPAAPAAADSFFGAGFFRLGPELFSPTAFGPVPDDYLLGVGDQVVVDVWGEVEFRLERLVDRDGTILLPKGGKIACANRTLGQVERAVRESLSRSYSGLDEDPDAATTFLDVSLGALRAIRVFVVGDVVRPGAYELTSVATVLTALYAAGGPTPAGTLRDLRLVRGGETAARLDLYRYLAAGVRDGDALLREGDTVFVPPRGRTVKLRGAVRRPLRFELVAGETLADLVRYAGGFTAEAARTVAHVERILPPGEREPERPDRVQVDLPLDGDAPLLDGDVVAIDAIGERLENWVRVSGNVKQPGRYQWRAGLDVAALITRAGGLWDDTLVERALIDRVTDDRRHVTLGFPLGEALAGGAGPVLLEPRDHLRVFSVWDLKDRAAVSIDGAVRDPGAFDYREGLTLRDLILQAGGLAESADVLKIEVARLRPEALATRDASEAPGATVDLITLSLEPDWLTAPRSFALAPHDRVSVRRLPWWERQRRVTLRGEVAYPGVYSLERPDERLSSLVARAGGLKPTAYPGGARIDRAEDGVGNVALDLARALAEPGGHHDPVLAPGDAVTVPSVQHTVKVVGAVGYPTSVLHEPGRKIGWYVARAGGYAEGADKWKTRVVYPNGLSRPIRRLRPDPVVMAGSTIVVPVKPPPVGEGKLATLKEIASIIASVATVWLVIDRTN